MFTGLVQDKGSLAAVRPKASGSSVVIRTALGPLELGESISVEGACLTVARLVPGGFEADVSTETLARTTLGSLAPGASANLERSLSLKDRLGGHLVSGHVDDTCTLVARTAVGDGTGMTFRFDPRLSRFIAEKGSVAVSGVSLTVNAVGPNTFDVMIIPHTLSVTSLGSLAVGAKANLEVDLVARYLARLVDVRAGAGAAPMEGSRDEAWMDRLAKAGIV